MQLPEFFKNLIHKEKQLPRYKQKLTIVFFHAIFLLIATILLQYTSFVRSDEINFLKWAAVWKRDIFKVDKKPLSNNVVFIDVSKDISLADDDEYGPPDPTMQGARVVITDRVKLAKLFSILNTHPNEYKYVVCDVLFAKSGPGDTVLKPQIEKLKKIVTSAIWDKGKLVRPIYKVPSAIVNYKAIDKSIFAKIPVYYNDSLKSLPVYLYEQTTTARFTKRHGLVLLNGKPTFNTVIPEFYYSTNDLIKPEAGKNINTFYLGELLADPDCFEVLKNKFILIGNYSDDQHSTYLEKISGTLILWDTYLTLCAHKVTISLKWLAMMYLFYFCIGYWIIIHPEKKLKEIHNKIKVPFLSKFLIKYISFIGILIVINLFSYFYFGTFISLFYIATYLTFLQFVIDSYTDWKKNIMEYILNL